MRKCLLSLALLCGGCVSAWSQVVINELMQSNIDCIMDDLNEFPDSWVELYNTGDEAVNLNGYRLGKTNQADEAWQLPSKTIGPKQYALVYCDKAAQDMHTDFRLESGKNGEVYLFLGTEVADHLTGMQKQPAPNTAYGRRTDGHDEWGYQAKPTPGAANCGQLCTSVLGEPVFSEPGRVVLGQRPISLTLSLPEGTPEGTQIRLTTDGSEPTETSTLYTSALSISSNSVVRAKLFCEGYLSPRSITHSYLFFPRNLTLPVVSIVTNDKYFNDSRIGIYSDRYTNGKHNYEYNWRRPINLEYFKGDDQESVLNQLCETRIMGGATRGNALKSLAIYANKRFGTKRFEYEFFPDQRPGQTNYKSLALRNAGNDFDYLYQRDAIIQCTMAKHTDLDWQAWSPAIVYINGQYRGILNVRERSNEDNILTNYDGLEDIDMVENWNELKEGTMDSWLDFQNFYAEHGHTLAEYAERIDWQEFINLMVMNLYYNNQDFPGNNIVMWRPRKEGSVWRFIAKDTDFGLGLYGSNASYNSIKWIYDPNYDWNRNWANQYQHTRLFRRMMDDTDFRREFIDRAAVYMGDFLNEKGTRATWDPMYEQIQYEYPNHRKLFNEWWPNYNEELNAARTWIHQRTNIFYRHLAEYYQLGTPTTLKVNAQLSDDERQALSISFNGVTLSEGLFDGRFFANRAITLKGSISEEGKVVTGWGVTIVDTSGKTETSTVSGDTYTFTMPVCNLMQVNAQTGSADGIDLVRKADWRWRITGDVLTLSHVAEGTRISLYDLRGMLMGQTTATGTDVQLPVQSGQLYVLKVGSETLKIQATAR